MQNVITLLRGEARRAIIFLANGFDEAFVVQFFVEQRKSGTPVILVGTQAGVIFGRYGLPLPTNYTVSEFCQLPHQQTDIICIPGDRQCASAILTDPRVIKIICNIYPQHISPVAQQILRELHF